jgi:hypothetical protein
MPSKLELDRARFFACLESICEYGDVEDKSLLAVPKKRRRIAAVGSDSDFFSSSSHQEHFSRLSPESTCDSVPYERREDKSKTKERQGRPARHTLSHELPGSSHESTSRERVARPNPPQPRAKMKRVVDNIARAVGRKKCRREVKLLPDERQIFKGLRFCKFLRLFKWSVLTTS